MRAAEFNHLRIAAQHEAWMQAEFDRCVNTSFDEPPTPEPSAEEHAAYMAAEEREMEIQQRMAALMDDEYDDLCQRAFKALYAGDPAYAKALGRAVEAARTALRDIVIDDMDRERLEEVV